MYAVRLKKFPFVAEPVQKKWHQFEPMAFCQLGIDILKLLRIRHAIIGGKLHPGQEYCCLMPLASINDGFQIVANGFNRCAAQPVIAAEFDNNDIRPMGFKRLLDAITSTPSSFRH